MMDEILEALKKYNQSSGGWVCNYIEIYDNGTGILRDSEEKRIFEFDDTEDLLIKLRGE
jgi:hypothetical protein